MGMGERFLFEVMENVLEVDSGDGCTTLNTLKPLNCTLGRYGFYGKLYLSEASIKKRD